MTEPSAPAANPPLTPSAQAEADRIDGSEESVPGSEPGAGIDTQTPSADGGSPSADTDVLPTSPTADPPEGDVARVDGISGEVEIECPQCALVVVGDSPRPTAAWFCPRCDYPLFWASPPAPDAPGHNRARRRLPGTGGKQVVGAAACWNCGEMNDLDVRACSRCSVTLPKPPVEVMVEPVTVEVETLVHVPFAIQTATWPFVVAAALAAASAAIVVTLLLVGG